MSRQNGAQLLMETLLDNGVELVIGNPGTSEMQFVAALDSVPKIRGVLALFEGVVTGAAPDSLGAALAATSRPTSSSPSSVARTRPKGQR